MDDPSEVVVVVEFGSSDEANNGRERLVASGVLDRFANKSEPTVFKEAEAVSY